MAEGSLGLLYLLAPSSQIENQQRKRQNEEAVNQRSGHMKAPSQEPQNNQADDDGPNQNSLRAEQR